MSLQQIMLCRYHYDPLDRIASVAPAAEADLQRFYRKNRLATQIQGALQRSVFQHEDQVLAQKQGAGGAVDATLIATDRQRSVLQLLAGGQREALSYTAYGHQPAESGLSSLLGFNGEQRDPVTGYYILGSGYRAFNPILMRFNSPDSFSPFDGGGLNAYAYCEGDPINWRDPTGHMRSVPFLGGRTRAAIGGARRSSSPVDIFRQEPPVTVQVPDHLQFVTGEPVTPVSSNQSSFSWIDLPSSSSAPNTARTVSTPRSSVKSYSLSTPPSSPTAPRSVSPSPLPTSQHAPASSKAPSGLLTIKELKRAMDARLVAKKGIGNIRRKHRHESLAGTVKRNNALLRAHYTAKINAAGEGVNVSKLEQAIARIDEYWATH